MAYTNIDDPSAYFQAKTYTGTSGIHDVTLDGNSDMQPDFVWFKNRTVGYTHQLYDSSRGVTKALYSQGTNAEATITNGLTRFDPDGFRVSSAAAINEDEIVCWNWKANGGTTSSNTDGNITSTVQSDTTAGFSLVTYTGNGSNNQTIGHGLGVQPSWWIVKRRDSTGDWWFGASSILGGTSNYLKLNSTAANAEINNIWGDSPTSSSVFRVSNNAGLNASGGTYVAYLFANKQGYSKFGSYVGNGNANGTFVYTGFAPAFIMLKDTSQATNWEMFDVKRNPFNVRNLKLGANLAVDENGSDLGNTNQNNIDILSNGFKMRTGNTDTNVNGDTYIYMAFAENPFVTSTGIPTTAR